MFTVRKRLRKEVPAEMSTHAILEVPFLCNGAVNTPPQQQRGCFVYGLCPGVTKRANMIVWISWVSRGQPDRIWAWELNWGDLWVGSRRWLRRDGKEIIGSHSRDLDWEFRSWQLADDGGIGRFQLRVESPAVKRNHYVCCSRVIFWVCDSVRLP
jgi:hypothetical protein